MALTLPTVGGDENNWGTELNTALTELDTRTTDHISLTSTQRALFAKTTSSTEHASTIYQAGTSGADVAAALNVVCDNPESSAMYLTGVETARGTLKIAHKNGSGSASGDANSAALSIDLKQNGAGGTAAKGIFITSTDGGTTGDLIVARNGGADLFNVSSAGDVYTASSALGEVHPVNHGVAAWAYDPIAVVNSTVLTGGTVYLVKLHVSYDVSVTKVYWHVATAGVTATAGQNFVGLYDSSGTRLATTNVDADITSTGLKTTTIASQSLQAGSFVWAAFVFNAGTIPALGRTSGLAGVGGLVNLGLSAASYRFATNGTGQTSLPASRTPGSNAQGIPLWAAIGA